MADFSKESIFKLRIEGPDGDEAEKELSSLMLESEEGEAAPVTAQELAQKLGQNLPGLLFLSACMTSEPDALLNSFSSSMIRFGVPSVFGWGGKVQDRETIRFAAHLYGYLAQSNEIEAAVAHARFALFQGDGKEKTPSEPSQDWHLARLYCGSYGGGVLCRARKARHLKGKDYGRKEFLDIKNKRIPVAGRREFVGRRRQIQVILREFLSGDSAGVVIHGLGRQDKSSLAARIVNRMKDHHVVVVYENYTAEAILKAFDLSLKSTEVKKIVEHHLDEVRTDPFNLLYALNELLEGPCRDLDRTQAGHYPVILVIDDFEQALDPPAEKKSFYRVKSDLVPSVRAVIEAFDRAETDSRLLITSRYQFTLTHDSYDLADTLTSVHLPPMEESDSRKQAAAKEAAFAWDKKYKKKKIHLYPLRTVRCIHTARGNPGLQNLLFSLSLEDPQNCDRALDQMEDYIETGKEPDEEKLLEFMKNLAINKLIQILTPGERELVRASTLFTVPVPVAVGELIAKGIGTQGKDTPGDRIFALGLWEPYEDLVDRDEPAFSLNSLVRSQAGTLTQEESAGFAQLIIHDLFTLWGETEGQNRPYSADLELTRLALLAKNMTVLAATAQDALQGLKEKFQYRKAAALAVEAVTALDNAGVEAPPGLLFGWPQKDVNRLETWQKPVPLLSVLLRVLIRQKKREKTYLAQNLRMHSSSMVASLPGKGAWRRLKNLYRST